MIVRDKLTINNKEYIKTYSDKGFLIKGGFPEGEYESAVDPIELDREYIETDKLPKDEEETEKKPEINITEDQLIDYVREVVNNG